MLKRKIGCVVLGVALSGSVAAAAPETGTLVLDVRPFDAETKMKKKVRKQLEAAGVHWGIDGTHLVISQVAKKHVNARLNGTPMGEQDEMELPAGEYQITCISFEFVKLKWADEDEVLDTMAYINEDVLSFAVHPGEVTRLEIVPGLRKAKAGLLRVFIADSIITVYERGESVRASNVSERTEKSIGWADYDGPWKMN